MINFSELLWKPRQRNDPSPVASESPTILVSNDAPELLDITPTTVQITAASRVVVITDPSGPGADSFRLLRLRLRELRGVTAVRSILVTSPLPRDGKSTVVMNLASVLADGGKRSVLVVEGDLHRPSIAQSLGLAPTEGFAECLQQKLNPLSMVQKLEPLGWYLLQSGTALGNPSNLLQEEAVSVLMQNLGLYFDWIVIDTPPLIPVSDALLLSRSVDTSLLVVRADQTPQDAVDASLSLLGPKHVLGIVFNGAAESGVGYSQYAPYGRKS